MKMIWFVILGGLLLAACGGQPPTLDVSAIYTQGAETVAASWTATAGAIPAATATIAPTETPAELPTLAPTETPTAIPTLAPVILPTQGLIYLYIPEGATAACNDGTFYFKNDYKHVCQGHGGWWWWKYAGCTKGSC